MLKSVLVTMGVVSISTAAHSEPVTAREAIQELKNRGASVQDSVLIFGEPMISADYNDQGYRLALSQCEKPDYACNVTVFSACQVAGTMTQKDLLDFANEQNKKPTARGTVFADRDGGLGDVICIRKRRDLHTEDKFDMSDVFAWHVTMRDFAEAVVEAKKDRQVRDLLGIDDATGSSLPPGAYASPPAE